MRRLAVLLAVVTFALVSWASASPAHADVHGWRWGLFESICVRHLGTSKPAYLVDYAVKQWAAHPDIRMNRRSSCSGYKQKIIIREGRYGKDRSPAWTSFKGTTFPTPCARYCDFDTSYWGQDQFGNWAWLTKSPVTIRINISYKWTYRSYRAMVSHEIGHAVSEAHTEVCDSVMSTTCLGISDVSTYDTAQVESLYPW